MKESDIRPEKLLHHYLELCEQDAVSYFKDSHKEDLPCPACGADHIKSAFHKWDFGYVVCMACGTLYQSPRPSREDFACFYREGPSNLYWAKVFLPAVAEARQVHMFRPKVKKISDICREDGFSPHVIADVGAGYGLFLCEWRRSFPDAQLIAIEPNPDSAALCRSNNLNVVECFIEDAKDLHEQVDLVIAQEVIEHVHDPLAFCRSLKELLRDKGRVLLTGQTVDGFDIQVLWEHSKSVYPPQHINFISISGFEQLLRRTGFSKIKISTPGRLDVDIVRNAVADRSDILGGQRFISHLLKQDESVLQSFQEFLSGNRLSSHCWVWAEK
ncbi:MAG: class I SAM-dependent methyltransferase [bacterium]